jgi:hypothetical protein
MGSEQLSQRSRLGPSLSTPKESNLTISCARAPSFWQIKLKSSMPRVGEFCSSHIVRLLLSVVIIVTLLTVIGFWLYETPDTVCRSRNPLTLPTWQMMA